MPLHNPSHPGRIIRQRLVEDEDGQKIDSVIAKLQPVIIASSTPH
jgi:antitoxin HigA-1